MYASVQLNGKYGKVGINGNLVIPCEYIGIDHYSNGMAKVKKSVDGSPKFGFVDYYGKEVIPCEYDKVERFGGDATVVMNNQRWGLVNKSGIFILPCEFLSVTELANGHFSVREDAKTYTIDSTGNRVE